MAEITDTIVATTTLSGDYKIQILTATPAAADDTITLTAAANGLSTIVYANAHLTAGKDAALTHLQTSWTGLVITVKQLEDDATTDASNWTSGALEVLVIGK